MNANNISENFIHTNITEFLEDFANEDANVEVLDGIVSGSDELVFICTEMLDIVDTTKLDEFVNNAMTAGLLEDTIFDTQMTISDGVAIWADMGTYSFACNSKDAEKLATKLYTLIA